MSMSAASKRLAWFCGPWVVVVALAMALVFRVAPTAAPVDVSFATLIPERFGAWTLVPDAGSTIVNPQQAATLQEIYDETLSRVYRRADTGEVVMLSIAYGRDQSHRNQVHKPEVCYPAQGFTLSNITPVTLEVAGRSLPSTRVEARLGSRDEFIQYWMLQGDSVIRGALQQNFYRAARALKGERTDGLLFRTSIIGGDPAAAYRAQTDFAQQLAAALPADRLRRLVGTVHRP